MAESTEVVMARMDERFKYITQELTQAREGRKGQYEAIESIERSMTSFDNRLATVEAALAKSAPTIEEFITIKHKVVGAGMMGKWVWGLGGVIITLLFSVRGTIGEWLTKM